MIEFFVINYFRISHLPINQFIDRLKMLEAQFSLRKSFFNPSFLCIIYLFLHSKSCEIFQWNG